MIAADDGALVLTSGAARLPLFGRSLPIPNALNADVTVRDWYDDEAERYRVALAVEGPLGYIFGFEGSFTQETRQAVDPKSAARRRAVAVDTGRLPTE